MINSNILIYTEFKFVKMPYLRAPELGLEPRTFQRLTEELPHAMAVLSS